MAESNDRCEVIAGWVRARAAARSPAELLELLERATAALTSAAGHTLTPITLNTILERVAAHARRRFPAIPLEVEAGRLTAAPAREAAPQLDAAGAAALVEYVLSELVRVLGSLTAEVLTARLEVALARVVRPRGGAER